MNMVVCSIRDSKTELYSAPLYFLSVGQAIRSFSDEINRADDKSQFFNHPGDFDLWQVASFNDHSGEFDNVIPPKRLAVGKEVSIRSTP